MKEKQIANINMQDATEKKANSRQSNFELLRILAMFLIIAHHFSVHGGFNFPTNDITIPRLWIQLIQMGGKVGVDIFVLISGYFLIGSTHLKISKLIKLWLQLLTFSLIMYAAFVMFGLQKLELNAFLRCFMPVTFMTWWFASTYFVLYLLSPFINRFLKGLDRKSFQKLLVLIFVIWCLIPTATNRPVESNNLLWFMYLYAIAAYIRLWHNESRLHCGAYFTITLSLVLLTFLLVCVFDKMGIKTPYYAINATRFYEAQQLPILLISIFAFLAFKQLRLRENKIINTIAASTFGIYLIHDYTGLRSVLWIDFFKNASYSNTRFIIPYSIGVICLVFAVCSCIELARIHFLEKNYMKLINKSEVAITNIIEKIFRLGVFENL